ncbi:MAG: nucleotide exchange factor GrpE [Candidatus Odinarchaeum yellowstonii]|uniref:Protein GrpE n=1 Tax=Odinarchaeota yellowstonii (strain LCB_4) TaxID=1841599 RepID=A0AAF0IBB4_ODILC|nr:MAG: nucleotide exchange factor GrpE [Candidatus Odinarchaeum yellowstonii]
MPEADESYETRIKQLEESLEESKRMLEQEKRHAEEYLTKLRYLQAEFENAKKRMIKDIENSRLQYTCKLIGKILTPIEELELALASCKENCDMSKFIEGIKMISLKLKNILVEEGVKEIEAAGKMFDPAFHEAVQFQESKEYPDNYVICELRKGYRLNDHVIRPSMVIVCKHVNVEEEVRNNG